MKKLTTKILTVIAACAALFAFASCNPPAGSTSTNQDQGGNSKFSIPENAVALQLYKKTADEVTDADKVTECTLETDFDKPFPFVKQDDLDAVKEGATIYIEVDCPEGKAYRIHNWSWEDLCSTIMTEDGSSVAGVEADGQLNYTASGIIRFTVDAAAKTKLAQAIEIHGNAGVKISKIAYVNPEA